MDIKVFEQDGQLWTTSLEVAGKFGKRHERVLDAIRRVMEDCPAGFAEHNFVSSDYTDSTGRTLPMILLSRGGFSLIAMGFTGKAAIEWKVKFIAAFDSMEKRIIQLANQTKRQGQLDWQQARQDGKLDRRAQTDTIRDFTLYAQEQGSKNAHRYYESITKMENKALFLLTEAFPKPDNLRNVLDAFQLGHLRTADNVVIKALREGMDQGLFYKDIYALARDRVMQFSELVGRTPILALAASSQPQASLI